MKRGVMKAISLLILAFFIAIGSWYAWSRNHGVALAPLPFSSDAWRSGESAQRGQMANDLIASRILVGKSPDEVGALLGPADDMNDNEWNYRQIDIGARMIDTPWYYTVRIQFSQLGRVEKVELTD